MTQGSHGGHTLCPTSRPAVGYSRGRQLARAAREPLLPPTPLLASTELDCYTVGCLTSSYQLYWTHHESTKPLPQNASQHADPRYSQEGWLDKPATPPLWGLSAVVTSPALRRAQEPSANHQQVQPAGAKCPTKRRALDGTRQQTTARRHRGLLPAENARQESEEQASTSQLSPVAGTLCDSVSRLASASTGPDCRDGGRSVSDRRPVSPTVFFFRCG